MQCIFILTLALAALVYSKELYTTEHDDFDIEVVVKDPEQMAAFLGCFVDTSGCSDITAYFKKDMAEAISQACAKCTQAQKHLLWRFLDALKLTNTTGYEAMKNKFDPERKYFDALEAAINNS